MLISLEDRDSTSFQRKGQAALKSRINEIMSPLGRGHTWPTGNSDSLSLRFLSSNVTYCLNRHLYGPICVDSVRLEGKENGYKYADAHTACGILSNKVLCVWHMSLLYSAGLVWQANASACKWPKISAPSQSCLKSVSFFLLSQHHTGPQKFFFLIS